MYDIIVILKDSLKNVPGTFAKKKKKSTQNILSMWLTYKEMHIMLFTNNVISLLLSTTQTFSPK